MCNGQPFRIHYKENDHCCLHFAKLDEWLRAQGLQSEACVGHVHARLTRAIDIAKITMEHIAHDPPVFLHSQSEGCDQARKNIFR